MSSPDRIIRQKKSSFWRSQDLRIGSLLRSANLRAPHDHPRTAKILATLLTAALLGTLTKPTPALTLPPWLQHIVAATPPEQSLYRLMHLPGADTLYPRPPKEAQTELTTALQSTPAAAELYALRARTEEQSLNPTAAEADWKQYVAHSQDPTAAKVELAAFYRRRLQTPQLIATLLEIAAAPEKDPYTNPTDQRSWRAFEQLTALSAQAALPLAPIDQAWLARYPGQPAVYARAFEHALDVKDDPQAQTILTAYQSHFPQDPVFPLRAQALLAAARGTPAQALAVYDRAFTPAHPAFLHSPELIHSLFTLLDQQHQQRAFVAHARAQLAAHPEGPEALNALARIFFYDQQAGRLPQAQQTLDQFRVTRENAAVNWSPEDLATLAYLSQSIKNYAEAARYDYALAALPGNLPSGSSGSLEPAAQAGLASLIEILLTAPDQPLALGAGNLTLYRDIATLDQGPGYWNGILSLWLNGTNPAAEYSTETAKAQTYFHRSKAAELLTELDRRFPQAPERPALHAALIHAQTQYGEPAAVVAEATRYLAAFPESPAAFDIANSLADAYQQQDNTQAEFALYDSLLARLAARTDGQPLTAAEPTTPNSDSTDSTEPAPSSTTPNPDLITLYPPTRLTNPAATQYAKILDRYLARLSATHQLPAALTLLRRELDRSPNDPLLYERLATFLEQNNLSAQQEAVFELAIARFGSTSTYDKLARLYLRERKRQAFATLTHQVVDIFSGTDLDRYFATLLNNPTGASPMDPGPQLALQLNLYAAQRFPHDLTFTRNLLTAYQTKPTQSPAAYEALLRRQWFADDDLRDQFLAFLSRTGKLQAELAALNQITASSTANPAALEEQASLQLWLSHPEQAAPILRTLTTLYPAGLTLNQTSISVFRSLSYLDPTPASLTEAVSLQTHLLRAAPDTPNYLATLGDLYAETTATGGEDLSAAAPYWRRIPALHPGTPAGYLTAATLFWDYFQYDDALAEIAQARAQFNSPTLYAYEAGAIQENRRDLSAAIVEYVAAATHPPGKILFQASVTAAVDALLKPPNDAADSNLQSTAQDLFNAPAAHDRLVQLATRPATAALVDQATAQPAAQATAQPAAQATAQPAAQTPAGLALAQTNATLTLRADILIAQRRTAQLAPLLQAALARASTADEAAAIATLAQSAALTPVETPAQLTEVDVTLNPDNLPIQTTQRFAPPAVQRYALTQVYESALTREAALTPDPVHRIEIQFELAQSLEDRKQILAATQVVDANLAANPRLLGVIRQSVDFYARTQQSARAIATLLAAAQAATPTLAHDFTLEAANRANDSGNPTQARALAGKLLEQSPYDPQLLAVTATSYARQNDPAGLKAFYVARLDRLQNDQAQHEPALTSETRKQNIALLRRGLIPALTRLRDYPAAEDQYIALLAAYPEDAATANEAALYALAHDEKQRLLAFLNTTIQASPRDSRFPILLAQIDTTFEDLPGALAAYNTAIQIRKDRPDLYQSRATLELLLAPQDPANLDRAADDYARLYVLTYHDPQWQTQLAALRARQNRPADAIAALVTAYPATGSQAADNTFKIAAQLAQWNLLPQALHFAQQASALAGPTLLIKNAEGVHTYVEILARLHQPVQAIAFLNQAYTAALKAPTPAPSSGNAEDDQAAAASDQTSRELQAGQALTAALRAFGQSAQTYDTPEQLTALAATLDTLHATHPDQALTLAAAASLADREALWRKQALLARAPNADPSPDLQLYVALEQHRLAFAELAQTLEAYAARLQPEARPAVRTQAAQAWRDAGNPAAELRVTRTLALTADPALRDRFFALLLARDPAALATPAATPSAAAKNDTLADAAVAYTLQNATYLQTAHTLRARGQSLPPVWTHAALALTGLYDSAAPAETAAAFTSILRSDDTVAAHLASKGDIRQSLAGDQWFPFASRYGVFLQTSPQPDPAAEDFLPATLERDPRDPAAYLALARTYAQADNLPAAQTEFAHVLEFNAALDPGSATPALALQAHDEQAVLLARLGRRPAALAEWRAALALLAQLVQKNSHPESFFTGFAAIQSHLAAAHLTLRPETQAILHPYLLRNGSYRSNELFEAAYLADPDPTLISTAAAGTTQENQILGDLETVSWLPAAARTALLEARLNLALHPAKPESFFMDRDGNTRESLILSLQIKLLTAYLAAAEYPRAQALLATISPVSLKTSTPLQIANLELAARTHHLEALLAAASADPDSAPTEAALTAAANSLAAPPAPPYLETSVDPQAARRLREYLFTRRQLAHTLQPADFLTLAQSRLDTNDLPAALELLRRLTLQPPPSPDATTDTASNETDLDPSDTPAFVVGAHDVLMSSLNVNSTPPDPNANTDAAAHLLESSHHPAEAIPFLRALTVAAPWNSTYRLRLGRALTAAADAQATLTLTALAQDQTAPYALRVQAAQTLNRPLATDSQELNLLARGNITPAEARQPYFVAARLTLARQAQTHADLAGALAFYREALAQHPLGTDADRTRLDLLLLIPAQAPDAPALVRLAQNLYTPPTQTTSGEDDTADTADTSTTPALTPAATAILPPLAHTYDLPTQTRLAIKLADIAQANHNPASAAAALRLALTLNPNPAGDPAITHRLEDLKAQAETDTQNKSREPILKKEIPDPSNVLPRLSALSIQEVSR